MHKYLSMFVVFYVLFYVFMIPVHVRAEIQQNVLVNCLDYYIMPDAPEGAGLPAEPGQPGAQYLHGANITYNGVSHTVMLKNKTGSTFTAGKPIMVMRNNTMGYAGQSTTKEAYCAVDKDNAALCTPEMMTPNGIKTNANFFKILDTAKPINPDASGNLSLPHVRTFTPLWNNGTSGDTSYFYGVQILADTGGQNQTNALGQALKLGTFIPAGQVPTANSNCVTIYWDPAGRVIDAKTLEPVQNVLVTLNSIEDGIRTKTTVPGNPFFVNPLNTDAGGNYTFAVNPGTYAFDVAKTGFTFPADTTSLQTATAKLQQLDPGKVYIDTTKIYNNPQETFVENAGSVEYRYMILSPTDPNYAGSQPQILSAQTVISNGNQLIQGVASHPKGIVKASVNGAVIAQTTVAMDGQFSIEIPSTVLPADLQKIQLNEEKVSLVAQSKDPFSLLSRLYAFLTSGVYAQDQINVSPPVMIDPIPVKVNGFTYAQNYRIVPNAKVNILAFQTLPYATGYADADGYISVPTKNLPPFGYSIQIIDPQTDQVINTQTPAQFIATNKTYAVATKTNYYQPQINPAPKLNNPILLAQIQKEATAKSGGSIQTPHITFNTNTAGTTSFTPSTAPTPAVSSATSFNALLPLILILIFMVGFAAVVLFASRMRSSSQTMV